MDESADDKRDLQQSETTETSSTASIDTTGNQIIVGRPAMVDPRIFEGGFNGLGAITRIKFPYGE